MYIERRVQKKEIPMIVQQAKTHVVISLFSFGCFVCMCGMVGFQLVTNRKRDIDGIKRKGPRIIVIGGGPGGSAVAATLLKWDHRVAVTVFDGNRTQELTTHYALAAAGHRSYDLVTRGPSTLCCPTSWTVTRDANLVLRAITSVNPNKQTVIDSSGEEHRYDALVIASGAQRDISVIRGLHAGNVDRDFVSLYPHGIRDSLMSTFFGNVLAVRVATRSNFETMDATRSHPGYWMSVVNTSWKFLQHFGRIGPKQTTTFSAITSDACICDQLSSDYNGAIEGHWLSRGINVITGLRLEEVDVSRRVARFRDNSKSEHKLPEGSTHQREKDGTRIIDIPFRMMILDLPLKAPAFIEQSGLSTSRTAGFVDVDSQTLQHRQFSNVFALGDSAAIDVAKSYGATLSQVPIVAENVLRMLDFQRRNGDESKIAPQQLTKYNGYSSFSINMTTWRVMWPEMEGFGTISRSVEGLPKLKRSACHVWDDSNWAGPKGVLQGVFFQLFVFEFMHWFFSVKGSWDPQHWFRDNRPSQNPEAESLQNA